MPLMPETSSTWSHCIGLPRSSLLPPPRTSSVTPSFSAHSTARRSSPASRRLYRASGHRRQNPRDVGERQLVVVHGHAAELGAAPQLGEHLARIEQVVGIEGALHAHLLVEVDLGELHVHQVALLDADAVLAGQHAADPHAEPQDVGAEFLGAAQLVGIVGVEQDQRMEGCRRRRGTRSPRAGRRSCSSAASRPAPRPGGRAAPSRRGTCSRA